MKRRPTSILTTLAVSVLALTLIAPWAVGQDPDAIMETRRLAEQGDADAQLNLGFMYATGEGVPQDATEAARWYLPDTGPRSLSGIRSLQPRINNLQTSYGS